MYKKLLSSILLAATFTISAQETVADQPASVEKSVFSVQTGLVGIWINNEIKLSNQIALRSELGVEMVSSENIMTDEIKYFGVPSISLEPKWYYNLEKRARKGKNIKGNSANSFSLRLNYLSPNLFMIAEPKNIIIADQINIIPKWTVRRLYGNHFILETGFGLGPNIPVGKHADLVKGEDVFVDFHARIGYAF